jgi:transcriptional regulator with XRE-family HTH domain
VVGAEKTTFAELLRCHRLTEELTQEALAERAGLSVNAIQKLETGGAHPQRETLRRLVLALHLASDELAVFESAGPANSTSRGAARGRDNW